MGGANIFLYILQKYFKYIFGKNTYFRVKIHIFLASIYEKTPLFLSSKYPYLKVHKRARAR